MSTVKIGGQDLVSVLPEELPPAGPGSKGRGRHAMAAEDSANGLVGAAHAEFEHFITDLVLVSTGSDVQRRAEVLALRRQLRCWSGRSASLPGSWATRDEIDPLIRSSSVRPSSAEGHGSCAVLSTFLQDAQQMNSVPDSSHQPPYVPLSGRPSGGVQPVGGFPQRDPEGSFDM